MENQTTTGETYEHLIGATDATVTAAVNRMTPEELHRLPRHVVETWPGAEPIPGKPGEYRLRPGTGRHLRVEILKKQWRAPDDQDPIWRIADIAEAAGVSEAGVGRWRSNFNNQVPNVSSRLPAPDGGIGVVKQPGDTDNTGGAPLWHPSTILHWLGATERLTADLYPHERPRRGRKPPGRPPRQRTQPPI